MPFIFYNVNDNHRSLFTVSIFVSISGDSYEVPALSFHSHSLSCCHQSIVEQSTGEESGNGINSIVGLYVHGGEEHESEKWNEQPEELAPRCASILKVLKCKFMLCENDGFKPGLPVRIFSGFELSVIGNKFSMLGSLVRPR